MPADVFTPRDTWTDKQAYDTTARDLVGRFQANFEKYAEYVDETVVAAAPRAVPILRAGRASREDYP